MESVIVPPMPLLDRLIVHWINQIPQQALIDVTDCFFLTILLMLVDTSLRILIEVSCYNKDHGKEGTIKNMLLAFFWYGWGIHTGPNGETKRYLLSKGMRNAISKKILLQYPSFSLAAIAVYIIPATITIVGMRVDNTLSQIFMMLPILFESASIIEKLNEVDPKSIKMLTNISSFFGKVWKVYRG